MVNTFLIQEDISKGQRIEDFTIEVFTNGAWRHVAEGTTVGYKRLVRFSDSKAEKLRVTVNAARGTANISNIGLYYAQPLTEKNVKVKLSDVSVKDWKTVGMPAEAANAIDGDPQTVWTAKALTPLVVDMGKASEVIGFSYAPAQKKTLRERFISIISMLVSMARIGLSAMPVENSATSCTILFLILSVSVRNIRRVTLNWSLLPK